MSNPSVAAVIVTWNSLGLVEAAVSSLRRQTSPPAQIIVVDNGSKDGTTAWLGRQPDIEVILNPQNRGFAAANNQGIARARGEVVLLLNTDVELAPEYIDLCAAHFSKREVGSVSGKLLRSGAGTVLDSTGHEVFTVGWARNRGEDLPDVGFDSAGEVFGVCAAAGLYRRAALEATMVDGETLDESYFRYVEDVDLDWRLRWNGWTAAYEPRGRGVHRRHASGGPRSAQIMRHILKNRLLTVVKNYDRGSLVRNAPGVAAFTLVKTMDFCRRRPSAALGLLDFARLIPAGIRKRRAVARMRRVPPSHVSRWLLPFPWRANLRRRLALDRGH